MPESDWPKWWPESFIKQYEGSKEAWKAQSIAEEWKG
jgi:hypothetical protein